MNEESNNRNIEPELEARIVALVLGEASDFEVEELNRLIDARPELAAFKLQMQNSHDLLQETATGEFEAPADDWKLPTNKRNAVLAAIRGEATVPAAIQGINSSVQKGMSARRRWRWKLAATLSGACLAGVVGVMAWPLLFVQSSDSALVASNHSNQLGVDLAGGTNMTFNTYGEPASSETRRGRIHGMNEEIVFGDRSTTFSTFGRNSDEHAQSQSSSGQTTQLNSNVALSAIRDTLGAGISSSDDFEISAADSPAEMPKRWGAAGAWMYESAPTDATVRLDDMLSELTTPERADAAKLKAADGLALLDERDESKPQGQSLPGLNRSTQDRFLGMRSQAGQQPPMAGDGANLSTSDEGTLNIRGKVKVQAMQDLGTLTLKGNEADVEKVTKIIEQLESKRVPAKEAITGSEAESLHRDFDSKATTKNAPFAAPVVNESQLIAENDEWFSKAMSENNSSGDTGRFKDSQQSGTGADRFDSLGYKMRFVRPELKLPDVQAPDGGSVMLGGIVAGRSPTSASGNVNLYVTPRIIIQEEEEPLASFIAESGKQVGESELAQGMVPVDGSQSIAAVDPPKFDSDQVFSFYMDIDGGRGSAPAKAAEKIHPDSSKTPATSTANDIDSEGRTPSESIVMSGANPGNATQPAEQLNREAVDFGLNVQDAPDAPAFGSRQLQLPGGGGQSMAPDLNADFAIGGKASQIMKEADAGIAPGGFGGGDGFGFGAADGGDGFAFGADDTTANSTGTGRGSGYGSGSGSRSGSGGGSGFGNKVPNPATPSTPNVWQRFRLETMDGGSVVTRDLAQSQDQSYSVHVPNEPMTGTRIIVKPDSDQSTQPYTINVPQVELQRKSGKQEQAQKPRQIAQESADVIKEIDAENVETFGVELSWRAPTQLKELMNRHKGSLAEGRGVAEPWEKLPAVKSKQQSELKRKSREFNDTEKMPKRTFRSVAPFGEASERQLKFVVKKAAPVAAFNEKTAAAEAFSTFSLHVSDVSFKLVMAALGKGEWPEAAKVRIEEFVNAFDYGDPMPANGEKVACAIEQSIHPFVQQRNLLRVSMKTAAEGRASKTPLRLTFLLDNSGSMERIDRQQTVRKAFAMLAQQLKPIDQVTLISFARQPRLLADKVCGNEAGKLVGLIDELPSEGGTNIEAALQLAFEKANEQQTAGAQNRIILLTDGAVNLGNANPESLSEMVTTMRSSGIAFDAAGISAEGLNDEILEALTRQGDGRYYLLDSLESVDDGFAKQIAGALRPSAKNVKVQVEFNPKRVGHYKLLGFEKHILKKQDFRNDKVDAAEMAAAEAGVAMYQFEAMPDGEGDVGSVSVRFRDLSTGQMVENRWPIPYEADAPRPDQASPSLRIATSAAMLAAKLKGEPLGASVDLQELSRLVSGLPEQVRSDKRVQQLQQMIDQARQLDGK